jgi:hypothetical protein
VRGLKNLLLFVLGFFFCYCCCHTLSHRTTSALIFQEITELFLLFSELHFCFLRPGERQKKLLKKKKSSPGNGNPLSKALSLSLSPSISLQSTFDACTLRPKWHARKALLHAQSFSEPAQRRIPTVADYVIFLTTLYDIIF